MTEEKKSTLAAAIVAAQAKAQAVGKDAMNEYHRYRYASAEAVIEEARGALSGAGLALITMGWEFHRCEPTHDKAPIGSVMSHYHLLHESGEEQKYTIEWFVIPEKGRPEDKAMAGALTTSLAYFLRGLLLLPRDDGDSPDQRDDRDYERKPAPEAQRGAAPPREPERPAAAPGPIDPEDAKLAREIELEAIAAAAQGRPAVGKVNAKLRASKLNGTPIGDRVAARIKAVYNMLPDEPSPTTEQQPAAP